MINQAQVLAVGRHVISYAAGATTVAVGGVGILYSLHGVSADQASQLTDAFNQLAAGLKTFVGAFATIASILAAVWAAYRSSVTAQVQAVAATGATVVTTPEIAKATTEKNIVSNADVTVVDTAGRPVTALGGH